MFSIAWTSTEFPKLNNLCSCRPLDVFHKYAEFFGNLKLIVKASYV